jgi:monothiol glutaredoxin
MPMCGFSGTVTQILKNLSVTDYKDVNILADEELRQNVKIFSNWPTYPQLYIKGELIGGADIVKELYQTGELLQLLKQNGLV